METFQITDYTLNFKTFEYLDVKNEGNNMVNSSSCQSDLQKTIELMIC